MDNTTSATATAKKSLIPTVIAVTAPFAVLIAIVLTPPLRHLATTLITTVFAPPFAVIGDVATWLFDALFGGAA